MARVLTQVMPLKVAQSAPQGGHANISRAESVHSEASDREESLLGELLLYNITEFLLCNITSTRCEWLYG